LKERGVREGINRVNSLREREGTEEISLAEESRRADSHKSDSGKRTAQERFEGSNIRKGVTKERPKDFKEKRRGRARIRWRIGARRSASPGLGQLGGRGLPGPFFDRLVG